MKGDGYRRPRLCRLCECPAVDGGVRLRKPNMEKLSRWWKAHWDTAITIEQKNYIVCHFCVWDLRFADQHSDEKEPEEQKWWPRYEKISSGLRDNYKFYVEELLKPCKVEITALDNPEKYQTQEKGVGHRHQCLYCPLSYSVLESLVGHAKSVHPDEFIHCNQNRCGKFFHSEEEKTEHTKREHQAKKESLKCVYCGKVSTNKANHTYHLLHHHRSQIIRCNYKPCKQMFKTAEERDKHFGEFHSAGKFLCCFCDRYFECYKSQWDHMKRYHKEALKCNAVRNCPNYFKTEEDRQKHVLEKHSKKFKCLYCNVSFQRRGNLQCHVKTVHKDEAFKCEYTHQCGTWYKTEEERQKHYLEDHESGADKVLCPFCNKKFSRFYGVIKVHLRVHHKKEKIIKCNYSGCPSVYFKSEEDKAAHVKEKHEHRDEKFRCVYCGKFERNKGMLHYHVNTWHKDIVIKCNFHVRCATYFKTVEDREVHVREVHLAEKIREAAPCLYCDQILAGKNCLSKHIKLNHPEIAIKCQYPQCGTYFKNQEEMEAHFSLKPNHKQPLEKKKPLAGRFKCALCQKGFYYKSALKEHFKVRHSIKKMCPHCKKPTASKSSQHIISDFCKVCNKKFLCLGLYRRHTLKCRPLLHCPVCYKSFKMKCELTYHCKDKHTVPILKWKGLQHESKGFKCDDCFTYFSSKNCFQTHRRLCHGSTIYTCDFCKKQFFNTYNLKLHIMRIHMGPTKFIQCHLCNLEVESKVKLMRHFEAKHLKQDLVQCEICGKKMKPAGLKIHLKLIH